MDKFLMLIPKVYFPSSVFLGKNSLMYLRTLKEQNNLILVSETAWEKHGNIIEKNLAGCSNKVHTIPPEPTSDTITELRELLDRDKYDKLIGFGGGSVMDVAKLCKLERDIDLILIPTTAGTGSEASQYSVFINERNEKETIVSEDLLPDVVLFNPAFLTTLPGFVTAYTGIDALSHAMEGLVSKLSNQITDSFAITAIDIILENIITAYEDSENLKARENLQTAGLLSGIVQSSASVGLIHAFAHYFGPRLSVPHGVAVAIFAIPVLGLNLTKTDSYQKLNESKVLTAKNFLEKLKELFNRLDLYEYHKKLDFSGIDFADAHSRIKTDVCTKTNPFIPSEDDIKSLSESMGLYHEC